MARERSLGESQAVALFLYVTIALQAELRRTEQGLVIGVRQGRFRRRRVGRALRGQQDELEDVLDVREAVFDGDTGHVLLECKHFWGEKVYWKNRPLGP